AGPPPSSRCAAGPDSQAKTRVEHRVFGVSFPFWHYACQGSRGVLTAAAHEARPPTSAREASATSGAGAGGRSRTPPNGGRCRSEGAGSMKNFIARFLRDEEGQDLVEYVLLISLIGLA